MLLCYLKYNINIMQNVDKSNRQCGKSRKIMLKSGKDAGRKARIRLRIFCFS